MRHLGQLTALYTQMLKARHSQAGKAQFLGQITAQLGLTSIKFRNTEPRATGQRVDSSPAVRMSWDVN